MNKSASFQQLSQSIANSRNILLLFVLWPFLALIVALSNYEKKEMRKIVYMFLIYFGLSFVIGDSGTDAYRYAMGFQQIASLPFSDFFEIVGGLYSGTSVDIVEPLIGFVVSRFTADYHFMFAAHAALFGFFYLLSITLLYNRYKENRGTDSLVFMVFFITVLPVTYINAPRMWTAAWIFFYGAYHVILYRDFKYLMLTMGACLVHWSFISANIVLIIYFLAGNRTLIYAATVVLSFLLPNLLTPFYSSLSLTGQGALQRRVAGYTSEDYITYVQDVFAGGSWFVGLSDNLIFYYLLGVILIIFILHNALMKEKEERNLFNFLLLFLAFVNFGMPIPSFGERFKTVFILFAVLYVLMFFQKFNSKKINIITLVGLFPMALYLAVVFRKGSDFINTWIFLPGFGSSFFTEGIPLSAFFFN